jgi:hypothetical protein
MISMRIELADNGFIAQSMSGDMQIAGPVMVFTEEEKLFEYIRKWRDDNSMDGNEFLSKETLRKLRSGTPPPADTSAWYTGADGIMRPELPTPLKEDYSLVYPDVELPKSL